MNDHIQAAKFLIDDGMALSDIGYQLNETPMSALTGLDNKKYGFPEEVFVNLVDRIANG